MNINVKLESNAYLPEKAHESDGGFDLRCREEHILKAHSSILVDTGVHIAIPTGCVGFLKSKSGLNVKHSITSEGVIDSGYSGSIIVKMYNHSDADYTFNAGDKVTQIVMLPIPQVTLTIVDELEDTARGNNGFGSSGR